MSARSLRIGILGGTFDPFHRGHLEPVLAVRDRMQWDRVIYVPAWRQPFKTDRTAVSAYHRFAMAVLATQAHDGIFVSPIELERGAISYTVDTLEALRHDHPYATLDWIIGDDNVELLGKWKNVDRIFELANFVVLTRTHASAPNDGDVDDDEEDDVDVEDDDDGNEEDGLAVCAMPAERASAGCIVYAPNETVPVSSTEIRRRVGAGEPIDDLVDPLVSRYIHHNRLYTEAPRD
jgi:nicotinate (nicotinamide) nucleotide adenylyltransferase